MSHAETRHGLHHQDQQTYDALFRHPSSGNIEWHSLLALFGHLGEVIHEPNGKVKLVRNGHELSLHPNGKDAQREEIADMRKFLQDSEVPSEEQARELADYVLVLVNAEVRIYRTEATDAKPVHLEPFDPHGWDKRTHNPLVHAPVPGNSLHREFFEKIAKLLADADRILLYGDGKGSGEEFDRLINDLYEHHRELADRVVGTESIDLSHMTHPEILAKAREQFAEAPLFITHENAGKTHIESLL